MERVSERFYSAHEQTPLLGADSGVEAEVTQAPTGGQNDFWERLTSPAVTGAALSLAGGVCNGLSTPLMGRASLGVGPLAATSLMQAGGALFCAASFWAIPSRAVSVTTLNGRAVAVLVGAAVTGSVISPAGMALAMRYTSAASVSLTMNLEPFLTAALAWPVYGERPTAYTYAGATAAIGSALLCTAGQLKQAPASGAGIGITVASAVSAAFGDLAFYSLRHYKSQQIVGALALISMVSAAALSAMTKERLPDLAHAGMLLGTGALAFGVTTTLYMLALPRGGVGRTTLIFGTTTLTSGTALSCAMGMGEFTPLIGASLVTALVGAAVLAGERQQVAETLAPADRSV